MDETSATRRTTNPTPLDVDYCSAGRSNGTNADYVLLKRGVGACVADGIGGAPLSDAVSRIACHSAMRMLTKGESTTTAISAARTHVMRFIADVDSPGSGASLAVIALDGESMYASWAGDIGLFVMIREGSERNLVCNLDHGRFPVIPPLGKGKGEQAGTFAKSLSDIDSFAVCTDGAWRAAGPENIAMLLAERETSRRTAAKIVFGRQPCDDSTALVARMPTDALAHE